MDLEILLASGETDTIRGIDETLIEENYLHILKEIEGDEVPGRLKTITVTREIDGPGDGIRGGDVPGWDVVNPPGLVHPLPRGTKTQVFELVGTYAPGMWMKVMYA